MQLITQTIGFIALLFVILSFQNDDRSKILKFLIIAQFLFVIHFLLLGASTAVVMNTIAAVRTFIFYIADNKTWANHKIWLVLFILLFWLFGLLSWEGYYSLLPILAMTIDSIAVWMKKTKTLRLIALFPRPFWFLYNFIVGSYAGMATEFVTLLSITTGIIRFDTLKKE